MDRKTRRFMMFMNNELIDIKKSEKYVNGPGIEPKGG